MERIELNSNEFTRLWEQGPKDAKTLIQRYPIAALVSIVVLSLLGLLLVFSFSITCIASGLLFLGAAVGMGRTIALDFGDYWKRFKYSLGEILLSTEILAPPQLESAGVFKAMNPLKASQRSPS